MDVANFCCPAYLDAGRDARSSANWNERQAVSGPEHHEVRRPARRTITDVAVDESGGQLLDIASQRALLVTKQVPPLPREFTSNTLTIYLIFEYSR